MPGSKHVLPHPARLLILLLAVCVISSGCQGNGETPRETGSSSHSLPATAPEAVSPPPAPAPPIAGLWLRADGLRLQLDPTQDGVVSVPPGIGPPAPRVSLTWDGVAGTFSGEARFADGHSEDWTLGYDGAAHLVAADGSRWVRLDPDPFAGLGEGPAIAPRHDLSGTWAADDGLRYRFEQAGPLLRGEALNDETCLIHELCFEWSAPDLAMGLAYYVCADAALNTGTRTWFLTVAGPDELLVEQEIIHYDGQGRETGRSIVPSTLQREQR